MMSFKKKFQQFFLTLLLIVALFVSSTINGFSQSKTTYVSKVVLQGWWWDYWNSNYRYNWSSYLTELAPRLRAMGFDAVWVPPFIKAGSGGDVGYGPFDPYDLGDKYQKGGGDGIRDSTRSGTKDDLLRMIAVMHANGIEVIFDAVLNQQANPGSNKGDGGQDPEATYSMANSNGYKNFRYVCYKTPLINDSTVDYWTRAGRWSKNYENFHPNPANNCNTGDICSAYFGPDIDYETPGAIGQSTNIPTSGSVTIIPGVTRPYVNPTQASDYMTNGVRDWMKWLKRQTNIDGYRFDAVKHFPLATQQNVVTDVKYNLPSWSAGGQNMFCIGEWVAGATDIDSYVGNVHLPNSPTVNEEAIGAFDFSLRGYGGNGGIYAMVTGGGGFNMQYLQYDQQTKKWMDYGTTRVYRTSPFVNSHDTYRPILDSVGNFSSYLGATDVCPTSTTKGIGFDFCHELGGNGKHIDPREPRLAAAYAIAMSFDGNPIVYFEDVFDIASTGKRWSHLPTSYSDLPVRADIQNIIQAHQKLKFKWGDLYYPTNYTGTSTPFYLVGASGDHFVVDRKGRAIIGITDAYNTINNNTADQQVWVNVADASWIGQNLYDYSGAHGVTFTTVQSDGRVLIKTAPCGHTISGAKGHGYSIWAPAPSGVTFVTVADIYSYLATYTPSRSALTTQEWEMADDLGDSHCLGLGQGGALPTNATNERIAGRIYADSATTVNAFLTPEVDGRDVTLSLYDNYGNLLSKVSGAATAATPITTSTTTAKTGWVIAKVRNTNATTTGQKCWVRVAYTAPAVVNTKSAPASIPTNISIWTGNKGTTDVFDCGNWEGGKVPGSTSTVIVYGHATPFPILASDLTVNKVNLFTGAQFTVNPGIKFTILSK